MGGLKKHLPITYWTFLIGSLAIAGVPRLAGFFSKDEILFETFVAAISGCGSSASLTSLLTATYMFRLVYLTFHGEERFRRWPRLHAHTAHARTGTLRTRAPAHPAHAHPCTRAPRMAPRHLHDAPPAMAIALVVLAHRLGARRLHRHPARARRPLPALHRAWLDAGVRRAPTLRASRSTSRSQAGRHRPIAGTGAAAGRSSASRATSTPRGARAAR